MLSFFKTDDNEALYKELFKSQIDEKKIQKLISGGADINQHDEHDRTLLFELAKKKKIESMKLLLKNGADINAEDKYGKTILNDAIDRDDSVIVRFLLSNGVDINHINSSKRTIFHDVALEGNSRIFRVLMQFNPDFTIQDSYGKTALFDAIKGKNIEIVKEIISAMDDPNIPDNEGQTPLFDAVLSPNHDIALYMIAVGMDVNHLDNDHQNVLFNAVILGAKNIEVVDALLKHGIKINMKDKNGLTVLDELLEILHLLTIPNAKLSGKYTLIAPENNYVKLTHFLMEFGLALDRADQEGKTILFREVKKKNYEAIDFLLASGANIDAIDNDGKTVLFDAILEGVSNINMIDYLILKGANIDHMDFEENSIIDDIVEIILVQQNGKKPYHPKFLKLDETEDYLSLLKKMLAHKPKINMAKRNGQTTLFKVVRYNNLELIKLFMNNGADANTVDSEGNTPLSIMIDEGAKIEIPKERNQFLERLVFMLKFRIDVDAVDKNGRTIFHKAVIADDAEVVEKLLSKRANLNIKDNQGRTALHHTAWKGNYKIARLLIAAGADMNEPDYGGFTVLNYAAILGHTNLVIALIASGVLMYNHHKKSKAVLKFFLDKLPNLDKLLKGNITDAKLRSSILDVINNLKKELAEASETL